MSADIPIFTKPEDPEVNIEGCHDPVYDVVHLSFISEFFHYSEKVWILYDLAKNRTFISLAAVSQVISTSFKNCPHIDRWNFNGATSIFSMNRLEPYIHWFLRVEDGSLPDRPNYVMRMYIEVDLLKLALLKPLMRKNYRDSHDNCLEKLDRSLAYWDRWIRKCTKPLARVYLSPDNTNQNYLKMLSVETRQQMFFSEKPK